MLRYHQTIKLLDFKRLFVSVTLDKLKQTSEMSPPLFKMTDFVITLNYKACDPTFRISHDWLNVISEFFVNYRYMTFYEHFVISTPSMCPTDYYFNTCSAISIDISVSTAVIAAVVAVSPPPPPISPTASLSKPSQLRQMVAHRWDGSALRFLPVQRQPFLTVLAREGHADRLTDGLIPLFERFGCYRLL